ncbi:hypothetical protein, partial [Nocardia cyriacigeorgica]|uniref:hypothetical protein n=1 Tax=Nocardia cyriacigeorgica TaxID=135487 RepID=UPI002457E364
SIPGVLGTHLLLWHGFTDVLALTIVIVAAGEKNTTPIAAAPAIRKARMSAAPSNEVRREAAVRAVSDAGACCRCWSTGWAGVWISAGKPDAEGRPEPADDGESVPPGAANHPAATATTSATSTAKATRLFIRLFTGSPFHVSARRRASDSNTMNGAVRILE